MAMTRSMMAKGTMANNGGAFRVPVLSRARPGPDLVEAQVRGKCSGSPRAFGSGRVLPMVYSYRLRARRSWEQAGGGESSDQGHRRARRVLRERVEALQEAV